MAEEGAIAREVVVAVLKANHIDVAEVEGKPGSIKLARTGNPGSLRVIPLPDQVNRRTLHFWARAYDVPIHHFYNPTMADGTATTVVRFPPPAR